MHKKKFLPKYNFEIIYISLIIIKLKKIIVFGYLIIIETTYLSNYNYY